MGSLGGKLSVWAVAALLAAFAVSCGGDEGGSAGGESTAAAQGEKDGQGNSSREGGEAGSGGSGSGGEGGGDTPATEHGDSGGGSAQFRVKGGDNSVQEFGSEASASEFEQAAEAIHGFFDAKVQGDWEAACSYLSAEVGKTLERIFSKSEKVTDKNCATALEALTGDVPRSALVEGAKADVGSLRVEGDRAFALYRGADGVIFAMPMKKEDGAWKVATLIGTPLT